MEGVTPLLATVVPMMPAWLDPQAIIQNAGPWALWIVALIIFAECAIFPVLPGDSLLFTVGMLCAMGIKEGEPPIIHYFGSTHLTLAFVMLVLFLAAIAGNFAGYYVGKIVGPPIFKPREGLMGKIFDPKRVTQTHDFFEKYGSKALILARFVPFVRTFVTMIAGIAGMGVRRFMAYTAIGGFLWACGITWLGYLLGNVPFIRDHIESVLIGIVGVSLVPMLVEYLLERRKRAKASA